MKNKTKGKLLKALAIALDVGVPLVATFTQFPLWVDKSSSATVSGLFLIFALLSCIPFIRQIREYMKSPSAPIVWMVLFALFVVLRNIINEMVVVCFFGMVANIVGAGVYKIGGIVEKKEDPVPTETSEEEVDNNG